jgi:hypothetical protein
LSLATAGNQKNTNKDKAGERPFSHQSTTFQDPKPIRILED